MALSCIFWVLRWAIFLALAIALIQYWLTTKKYIFTEEAVAAIAKKHVGPNYQASYRKIHAEFERQYPGHILPATDLQWIFVNAGGWMGSMCLLHASLTEYVLFFGTALDTSGHSGRYWANVSDTILTGSFKQWPEGTTVANVYKPGADPAEAYRKIHKDLQRQYPGHVLPKLEWVFINAGGYMGAASWAHASLTEYIAFFGSAIGAKGHSGRHWANITNTIIKGKVHGWSAGSFKLRSFKAGDVLRLPWGHAEAMDLEPDTWTVEYGRGFIPATMGWASADTIFGTLDFVTLYNTARIYSKGVWMEFCFTLGQANDYVKGLLT